MKQQLLAAAVLGATLSGGAQAALTFEAWGGFVGASQDSVWPADFTYVGGSSVSPVTGNSLYTSIQWGTPAAAEPEGPFGGQSGASINVLEGPYRGGALPVTATPDPVLVFTPPGDPQADPGPTADPPNFLWIQQEHQPFEEWRLLGSLTHWNRPINNIFGPAKVDVEYLFRVSKGNLSTDIISQTFTVAFKETDNNITCVPEENPSGSTDGCDDTFQFFGEDKISFTLGNKKYDIVIAGFCQLATGPCPADRDFIFYSGENGDRVGYVYEQKIPAPGVLALISAGLLGLGYARRRAKA